MKKLITLLIFANICSFVLAQSNQWNGSSNTDWHNAANWSLNRIPLADDDVVIPGAPSNKPIISTGDAVCYSLTIQSGATLTMQLSRTLTLNGNWSNQAGASGFVANNGTVAFAGTVNQQINNIAGTETFNNLIVNKSSGQVTTHCNFVIMGDFTLLGGNFAAQTSGKTYTFYGNVTFNGSGVFLPQGATYFKGATNTSFQNNGYSTFFVDFELEKTSPSNKLSMYADIICSGFEFASVEKGILDLGGFRFQSNAPIHINNGGKMLLPPGSLLNIRNSIHINSGGELEVAGNPDNPPLIYKDISGSYSFEVNSGGTIKAEHAIFQNMNADGIHIKAGAIVDPEKAFNFCTFQYGVSGGVLLTINNNQNFTVAEANFPSNSWGSAYNVRKTVDAGNVNFYAATGAFAGEDFDDDPHNRITWEDGVPTNFSVFNQSVINGIEKCFNAKQTLTTQHFYVYNGGQATLIAGQKIVLLPNTWILPGGYLHAWITTDESYCNNLKSIVAVAEENEISVEYLIGFNDKELMLNIFPNPTPGLITIELFNKGSDHDIIMQLYNMQGELMHQAGLSSDNQYKLDLSEKQPGIYIVRVIRGEQVEVGRIIKQ